MQSLTLRVILRAVFGYEPGAERGRAARPAAGDGRAAVARPRGMLDALGRDARPRRPAGPRGSSRQRKRAVDEILYAEIARRRAAPDLDQRDDVFSALLLARDEDGEPLTDREVRDELLTLLLAGHETTATGLAWTFDLLLHDAARAARWPAQRDDRYLDAVVKESLRIRPVIPGVGPRGARASRSRSAATRCRPGSRSTRRSAPSTAAPTSTPSPARSAPERFLGRRRARHLHLGPVRRRHPPLPGRQLRADRDADRARRACSSAPRCAAVDPEPAKAQFRAITLAPKGGVRVRPGRAPLPALRSAAAELAAAQRAPAA